MNCTVQQCVTRCRYSLWLGRLSTWRVMERRRRASSTRSPRLVTSGVRCWPSRPRRPVERRLGTWHGGGLGGQRGRHQPADSMSAKRLGSARFCPVGFIASLRNRQRVQAGDSAGVGNAAMMRCSFSRKRWADRTSPRVKRMALGGGPHRPQQTPRPPWPARNPRLPRAIRKCPAPREFRPGC